MFSISKKPLEDLDLQTGLAADEAGAFCSFTGQVRNHNEGQKVIRLEYEAFEPLCQKEAEKIFQEIRQKFDVLQVKCVHRVGQLNIGEMAVWVGVIAAHRDDAFKACRYVIDEIKSRLPIWKKEYYENGDSGWINCQTAGTETVTDKASPVSAEAAKYYSRQISLPEVGPEGQKKLKQSKVLVVGAGGLGCSVLNSLATAGIGTIGICEYDTLETSNLHRQPLYTHADVGKPKIDLAVRQLVAVNPFIKLQKHPEKITAENAKTIISQYDILIDCTDNFLTKFLLNDAAVLFKKVLIQSSIYQFEGNLWVYEPQSSRSCLRCLWPTIPPTGCVGTCTEAGVLGVIPSVLGNLQAMETLKYILGLPNQLDNETLIFDLIKYRIRTIKRPSSSSCPLCGNSATIKDIKAENYETEKEENAYGFDLAQVPRENLSEYQFVDIRESAECLINPIHLAGCIHRPLSKFKPSHHTFDKNKKYLIFCEKGLRSQRLVEVLREQGIANSFSVDGGTDAIKNCFKAAAKSEV